MSTRLTPWMPDRREGDIRRLYLPEREEAVTLGPADPDVDSATGEDEGCGGYCWIVWDRKSGDNVADGHGVPSKRLALKQAIAALRRLGELPRRNRLRRARAA